MAVKKISSGSKFEKEIGYSRAVVKNNIAYVSGTTGYNYATNQISNNILEQTEQCIQNIRQALSDCGGSLEDIVRVTYILPSKENFKKCWPILRKYFAEIRPAATMLEAGLINDEVLIEIEVTADLN